MRSERVFSVGILAGLFAVVVVTSMASEEEAPRVDAAPLENSIDAYERWELPSHLPSIAIEPFGRLPEELVGGTKAVSTRLEDWELLSVVETIRRELDRYPPAFLARIRLFRIALCERVEFDSTSVGGLANPACGLILLAVDADSPGENSFLQGIHHEVFHLADAADKHRNRAPEALGEFRVEYETDPVRRRELLWVRGSGRLTQLYPGFLTNYSRRDPGEDFAEIFGYLMVNPRMVRRRADADPVLAAKLALVQTTLKRLAPEDPEFWRR